MRPDVLTRQLWLMTLIIVSLLLLGAYEAALLFSVV